jgi:hypothetical protein
VLNCWAANEQEEANAPLAGRRKSVGGRMADPNFIGYTYKNWDAVRPPNSALAGDCAHMCCFSPTPYLQCGRHCWCAASVNTLTVPQLATACRNLVHVDECDCISCAGGRVHVKNGQTAQRSSLSNIQAAFESISLDR